MFADFDDAGKRLVLRVDFETGRPEVASEAFERPDYPACFEIEDGPVAFGRDGSAADVDDGANGTVELLLCEGSTKPIDARIRAETKRAGFVGNRIPVGEDQRRRLGQVGQKSGDGLLHLIGVVEVSGLWQTGWEGICGSS